MGSMFRMALVNRAMIDQLTVFASKKSGKSFLRGVNNEVEEKRGFRRAFLMNGPPVSAPFSRT